MIHLRRDGREGSRPRFSAGLRYILLFCDRVPSFLFFFPPLFVPVCRSASLVARWNERW